MFRSVQIGGIFILLFKSAIFKSIRSRVLYWQGCSTVGTVDSDGRRMSDPWPATRTSDWPTKRGGTELAEVRQCSKTRSVDRLTVLRCLRYVALFRPIKTSDYHTWHARRPLVNQLRAGRHRPARLLRSKPLAASDATEAAEATTAAAAAAAPSADERVSIAKPEKPPSRPDFGTS